LATIADQIKNFAPGYTLVFLIDLLYLVFSASSSSVASKLGFSTLM